MVGNLWTRIVDQAIERWRRSSSPPQLLRRRHQQRWQRPARHSHPDRIPTSLIPQFASSTATPHSARTMASWLDSYYAWADVQEHKLLEWVDPDGGYKVHPMADYPLANFASVYAICVGYLLFVIFGTAIMKLGVPAFNTSALQFIYNPLQVIVCSYMFLEAAIQAYRNDYTATPCNPFNHAKPVMSNVLYLFFLSKILDLCDTVFIILGKKWRQLSVLHVYHHLSVLFVYYVTYRCAYDADSYPTIVLNGFVHTIMYTYYFVSAHTKQIWWKKYLTKMQLIQFVLMNIQGYLAYSRACTGMPWKVPVMYLAYVQSLFWLFVNFYVRAYLLRPAPAKTPPSPPFSVCSIFNTFAFGSLSTHQLCDQFSKMATTHGLLLLSPQFAPGAERGPSRSSTQAKSKPTATAPALTNTHTHTMATLLESYVAWADAMELRILDWVDPNGGHKLHPMANYPLANFATIYAICTGYLAFVIFGTLIMKMGVPAFNTSALQFIYNPTQVIVCSYMFMEAAIQAYRHGYTAAPCNAFNAANPVMGNVLYFFFLSKILDLCDTVFIVLGKKWKQLSILHVYHHSTVLFLYFVAFRCTHDGDIYTSIVLNGFVHTIMYTYYFVSSHTRDIWWKKYLTTLQIIQFILMNVQGILAITRDCPGMPRRGAIMYLAYVQSLFWLFVNFYIRAYVLHPKQNKLKAA
ncbi:TPA: hypothetical protein N0F65_004237 [Lagenidium giganteum]|uniref:Elongation of fatty acids protein n=1 Tax=Lagenidium giganteum TaxID=4803 RepID=A0AAV2ZG55_9STRA|nr:TPA: hypothetical protein N0F65_004237 [Lagenidium giganteum]